MIRNDEDFDQILNSLDDDLDTYENAITQEFNHEENQDNPQAQSSHHLPGNNLPNVNAYESDQTLLRNRVRNAKELSAGIEDILNEMPSRTLGRRGGAQVKDAANHFGTISRNTFSRRFGRSTFKRRHSTYEEIRRIETNVAKEIYSEMKDDDGEVNNEDLRELPMNMNVKKQIRNQALAHRKHLKNRNVGCFKLWKYKMSMKWRHVKEKTKKSLASAKLWDYHLKQVEGNFGSGVVSYFTFLRGLFILSIPSFVLNFGFISIPQLLVPANRTNSVTFTGEELLTGANWLTETIMYYGFYTDQLIEAISGAFYDMKFAYLLATAGYFLLCLILLIKTTATNFRQSFIDTQENQSNFISKVFCSWDYGITSETASKLQQKTITTELKEILSERQMATQKRTLGEKLEVYAFRLVTWSIVLGIIAGSMTLIYFLQSVFLEQIKCNISNVPVLPEITLALIVSTINLIVPIIFNAITMFEKYKYPRHQLYIAAFRNFLLKIGLLAVICTFWAAGDVIENTKNTLNCTTNTFGDCWETALGQEAYRLVVIDFLFSIIFATFCAEFLRRIFATYCCKSLTRPEFSIVNNVMDLIYGQTLCWIGVFFSPLLPLIVIIKYFLMFYIKKISVMQNCVPPKKRWRAAQTRTLFNFLLLLSFLLSAVFLCVVVFRLTPSTTCGPYRGLEHAYDVVVLGITDLAGNETTAWLADILTAVGSVWVLDAVVVALVVAVVINHSRSKGYKAFAKALREQIKLEGKDKALILQWLQYAASQLPSNTPGPSGRPNHVVPILDRHRDSVHSSRSSRAGSVRSERPQTALTASNVLTHVDPQHVQSGALADQMHRSDSISSRRSAHKDPLLRQALRNQQQQPPATSSHIPEPDYMDLDTSQFESSVYEQSLPSQNKQSSSASSSPVVQRRQQSYNQQRPNSMFVDSSKYGFETSSVEDEDGYSVPAWKRGAQTRKQNPQGVQMQEMRRPQSAYYGYAEPDYDEKFF